MIRKWVPTILVLATITLYAILNRDVVVGPARELWRAWTGGG